MESGHCIWRCFTEYAIPKKSPKLTCLPHLTTTMPHPRPGSIESRCRCLKSSLGPLGRVRLLPHAAPGGPQDVDSFLMIVIALGWPGMAPLQPVISEAACLAPGFYDQHAPGFSADVEVRGYLVCLTSTSTLQGHTGTIMFLTYQFDLAWR